MLGRAILLPLLSLREMEIIALFAGAAKCRRPFVVQRHRGISSLLPGGGLRVRELPRLSMTGISPQGPAFSAQRKGGMPVFPLAVLLHGGLYSTKGRECMGVEPTCATLRNAQQF